MMKRNPWRGDFRELKEKMEREEYVQKITDDYEEYRIEKEEKK